MEQLLSAPAVQFKGSGWYVTDYARKSGKGGSGSNGSSGSDQSSGSDSGSSESKPSTEKSTSGSESKTKE